MWKSVCLCRAIFLSGGEQLDLIRGACPSYRDLHHKCFSNQNQAMDGRKDNMDEMFG
jgi:hypothetical protein